MVRAVGRHSEPRVTDRPSSKLCSVSGGSALASNPAPRIAAAASSVPYGCMSGIQSRRPSISDGGATNGGRADWLLRGRRSTSKNASMRVM